MTARRRALVVVVVAVLGIALAAAITWGTSQLVRQRIGLASEPLTAGRRLLPTVAGMPARGETPAQSRHRPSTTSTPSSAPSPRTPATSTSPRQTTTTQDNIPPTSAPGAIRAKSVPQVAPAPGGDTGDSSAHRDD
jgi:hypothetical protein